MYDSNPNKNLFVFRISRNAMNPDVILLLIVGLFLPSNLWNADHYQPVVPVPGMDNTRRKNRGQSSKTHKGDCKTGRKMDLLRGTLKAPRIWKDRTGSSTRLWSIKLWIVTISTGRPLGLTLLKIISSSVFDSHMYIFWILWFMFDSPWKLLAVFGSTPHHTTLGPHSTLHYTSLGFWGALAEAVTKSSPCPRSCCWDSSNWWLARSPRLEKKSLKAAAVVLGCDISDLSK